MLTATLTLAVSLSAALPQDPAQSPAPPIQSIFGSLTQREGIVVSGSVKKHSADDAGGGMRMMIGGPGGGGSAYEGGFDASVDPSGRRLVVSDGFPGFGIYSGDRGKLLQIYFEDAPVDVKGLDRDLSGLLDFGRLARYSADAEWKAEREEGSERTKLTAVLPAKLIPAAGGNSEREMLRRRFEPQVMRVEAEVELEGGMLKTARYLVVYSDPMAAMRRARGGGGGEGGTITIDSSAIEEGEVEEGDTVEYRMRFQRGKPTKALRAWEQISTILLAAREDG
ncbi:MAG: hypothetical protein GY711_02865 [bacterium]|nr:hypothetical protein [bacterium]